MPDPDPAEVRFALEVLVEETLKNAYLAAGRRPSMAASTARLLTPTVIELILEDEMVARARAVLGKIV